MASVFLTDVDDYIGSSQACVNPLFTSGAGSSDDKDGGAKKDGVDGDGKNSDGKGGAGAVRLDLDDANAAALKSTPSVIPATSDSTQRHAAVANPRTRRRRPRKRIALQSNPMPPPADGGSNSKGEEKERATVSVADCLACSGCVTSAEAVLVDRHSIPTLRANCRPPLRDRRFEGGEDDGDDRLVAFTVSPAVVADLTRLLHLERRGHDDSSGAGGDAAVADTARLAVEATKVLRKLSTFLHGELGADVVVDGGAVADVSLVESAEEFVHRYRQSPLQRAPSPSRNGGGGGPDGDVDGAVPLPIRLPERVRPPTPSVAISATETRIVHRQSPSPSSSSPSSSPSDAVTVRHEAGRPATPPSPNGDVAPSPLPVLTSSCPGFVCYVEKTAPHCVPHFSSAKSPMAVSGFLLKHRTSDLLPCLSPPPPSIPSSVPPSPTGGGGGGDARKNKLDEGGVGRGGVCYHVAIMPCHDKKLEASRRDLAWNQIMGAEDDFAEPAPDVDLVITTTELVELITEAAEAEADAEVGEGGESEGGGGEGAENEAGGGTTMSVMEYFENIPPAPLWHCGDGSSLAPTGAPDGCRETELSPPTTGGEGGVRADDAEEKKSEPNSRLIPSSSSHRAMGGGTDGGGVSLLLKVDRHHEEGGGESPAAPPRWASPTATSSTGGGGSHADHVFRLAALELFGFRIPPDRALPWRSAGGGLGGRRNDDDDGAGGGGVGGRRRVVVRRRRRGADGGGREQRQSSRLSDFREVALYRHHDGTYSMDPTARGGANAEQSANGDVVSSAVTTGGTADAGGAADTPAAVPVLRFAAAYGFRNIQGLVQRMKKNAKTDQRRTGVTISEQGDTGGSCDYHYVEAMACPSGCVNGGGQVRSRSLGDERLTGTKPPKKERPAEMRERAGKTNSILDSRCVQAPDTEGGECPSLVRAVYRGRVDVDDGRGADAAEESSRGDGGVDRRPADDDPWGPFSGEARRTLHTRFHAVPKLELSTGAVAGVSLSDTKW